MNPWRYVLRAIGDDNLSRVLVDAKAIVATDRHRLHAAPHGLGEGPWLQGPLVISRFLAEQLVRAPDGAAENIRLLDEGSAVFTEAVHFPPWRKLVARQPRIAVDASTLRELINRAKPHFSQWRHAAYDEAMSIWHARPGDQRRDRDDRPHLGDFCPTLLFGARYAYGGWSGKPKSLELGPTLDGWPGETVGMYNAEYLDDATRGLTVTGLEIVGGETTEDSGIVTGTWGCCHDGRGSLICPLRIVTAEGCLALVQSMRL